MVNRMFPKYEITLVDLNFPPEDLIKTNPTPYMWYYST